MITNRWQTNRWQTTLLSDACTFSRSAERSSEQRLIIIVNQQTTVSRPIHSNHPIQVSCIVCIPLRMHAATRCESIFLAVPRIYGYSTSRSSKIMINFNYIYTLVQDHPNFFANTSKLPQNLELQRHRISFDRIKER